MTGKRSLSTALAWGRELIKTHELEAFNESSQNAIIPVIEVLELEADAQPRQMTISGILNSAIKAGIVDPAGGGVIGGSDTQVQFNNSGTFAGSADLTWDDTGKELGVGGDINLNDGGTYATTLQLITPTANRTISFPDATGTVGLVGGSSGQLVYNNAGAYAGAPSTSVEATGNITLSLAGAASTPPVSLTGTWFSGGTSTTTKPQLLIEPVGTTSTAWSTSGTGLGVNAASGFAGRLFDFQVNGSSKAVLTGAGLLGLGTSSPGATLHVEGPGNTVNQRIFTSDNVLNATASLTFGTTPGSRSKAAIRMINSNTGNAAGDLSLLTDNGGSGLVSRLYINSAGNVGVGTTNPTQKVQITDGALSNFYIAPGYGGGAGTTIGVGGGEYLAFSGAPFTTERMRIDSSGRLLVGTSSDSGGALLQVNGDRVRVGTAKTPASATATGTAGEICWDANYVYVCTATNTWKRSALSSW